MTNLRPYPKKKRVTDQKTIDYVRNHRDGVCVAGLELKDGCIEGLHVHHIKTKGSGGDDVETNLITLCPKHHDAAHRGYLSAQQLLGFLEKRYGSQR